MPIELTAGEVDESVCSLLVSDMAMAALGTSALNKIAALNNTRVISSVLDLSANMFPPNFGLQPGKLPDCVEISRWFGCGMPPEKDCLDKRIFLFI